MGWESFDVVRFELCPLFQGQMRIAKIKCSYNSLIHVPRGLQCHTILCVSHFNHVPSRDTLRRDLDDI